VASIIKKAGYHLPNYSWGYPHGRGRQTFKPVGEKFKNPWHPSFPWQSPPQFDISSFWLIEQIFDEPYPDSKLSNS